MSESRHCGTILQLSVRTLQMVLQVEFRIHDVGDRPYRGCDSVEHVSTARRSQNCCQRLG
jgi:hypothetical protein